MDGLHHIHRLESIQYPNDSFSTRSHQQLAIQPPQKIRILTNPTPPILHKFSTPRKRYTLKPKTKKIISHVFAQLDYPALGKIYCDESGDAFWQARKGPCQTLGMRIATQLKNRLRSEGRSLYVGAGVPELPMLIAETTELHRSITAHNLRIAEVATLNKTCSYLPFEFRASSALRARGRFDHIWILSVLNDPECYPETSALSYGHATPVDFDADTFKKERRTLLRLVNSCLSKLTIPGLVTTSVEEIPWITAWCLEKDIPFRVENTTYPTAIVRDPLCFIHLG